MRIGDCRNRSGWGCCRIGKVCGMLGYGMREIGARRGDAMGEIIIEELERMIRIHSNC